MLLVVCGYFACIQSVYEGCHLVSTFGEEGCVDGDGTCVPVCLACYIPVLSLATSRDDVFAHLGSYDSHLVIDGGERRNEGSALGFTVVG